ncbi:hypothetical protein EON64_15450 [archaeon]|nr:MAG: hypothetical protein EON64_15450 [archaeon]
MRDCGEPACNWNDWQDALSNSTLNPNSTATSPAKSHLTKQRIVLSYAHNGFGNQLWEHSVAFMIAESLKARLYIAVVPDYLSPGGYLPPNTWTGMGAMERLLPRDFIFENLPANSSIRSLCDQEAFYVSDRPVDWKSRNYSVSFKPNLVDLLTDPKPRCLKLLGYFQNLPLCSDDARRLWTERLLGTQTQGHTHTHTHTHGHTHSLIHPQDISVYLRCVPRHYHFNHAEFYEAVLNNTIYRRVWLFMAPECPTRLSDNPAKDGPVAAVVRLLMGKYNATRYPQFNGTDENLALLHDLGGLVSSKKVS